MNLTLDKCLFQVRAEITSKEKEEEDMMEKVQKETKYESWQIRSSVISSSVHVEGNIFVFQEGRGSGRKD